jgi:hypothetical protein
MLIIFFLIDYKQIIMPLNKTVLFLSYFWEENQGNDA